MGRDPEYLAFLRTIAEPGASAAPVSIAEERATHTASLVNLPREPVAMITDLLVRGADGPLPARLYRPYGADPAAALPALVFFHGGGWYLGDVTSYDPICRTLANACATAVVSVGYRRAPEHPFPAALDDAYSATGWVHAHAGELDLDAARLGVAGDSAGGNLAAAVALRARERRGPALSVQLLVYPALDLTRIPAPVKDPDGLALDDGGAVEAVRRYLDGADPAQGDASPLRAADVTGLPPAVLVTAEYDKLRVQGEAYARRLRGAGVPVILIPGTGLDHGFVGWCSFARAPRAAVDELGSAVRALLATGS